MQERALKVNLKKKNPASSVFAALLFSFSFSQEAQPLFMTLFLHYMSSCAALSFN